MSFADFCQIQGEILCLKFELLLQRLQTYCFSISTAHIQNAVVKFEGEKKIEHYESCD